MNWEYIEDGYPEEGGWYVIKTGFITRPLLAYWNKFSKEWENIPNIINSYEIKAFIGPIPEED